MANVKINLEDAAKSRGCSVDYLLGLAEEGQLTLFARIAPFTSTLANYRREKGTSPRTLAVGAPTTYTVLIEPEVAFLRHTKQWTVEMLRQEGDENGVFIPSVSSEYLFYWLDKPQTIGLEQICVNETGISVAPSRCDIENDLGKEPRKRNVWNAAALEKLRLEFLEPGCTHDTLAARYGVRRQLIGRMLEKATPKKANPFSPIYPTRKK